MTVFVVHEVEGDVTDAQRFGEIRYVNHRYINADELDGERLPTQFVQNMLNAAIDFNNRSDFVLITGDHLQLIAFTSMLVPGRRFYRVLRWDRREKAYFPAMIEME